MPASLPRPAKNPRRLPAAAALLAAALFLFAPPGRSLLPAEESALTPVLMQLDWIENAQFAGLYQAIEQGYYTEVGLEVTVRPTDHAMATVESVLGYDGLAFGSAESSGLLAAHAAGAPIKAVATMFQASPIGWMYLQESGITTFDDLAGKRVGIHADGEKILAAVSAGRDIGLDDMRLPKVGYDIAILLRGEVDAMQAYVIDEYVKLRLETDGACGILLARDFGYSAYSQVLFTTATATEAHPEKVRAFLAATQKGWTYALDHPEETVELILSQYSPDLDYAYQLASLREIDKLVRPDGAAPLAPLDPAVFSRAQEMYLEHGLIEQRTDLGDLLDLRFTP